MYRRSSRRTPQFGQEIYDLNRVDDTGTQEYIGRVVGYDEDWHRVTVTYHRRDMSVGPLELSYGYDLLWDARGWGCMTPEEKDKFRNPMYIHVGGNEFTYEETTHYYIDDIFWSDSRRAWYVE